MRSHRNILLAAASLSAIALSTGALAQDATPASDTVEEVVVTGIRGAQMRAVDVKRNADSVVDSISAEDIGKLPDVTIADSLQRITGVQIRREAGEGGAVNIRGLPQVTTLLNGEQYLGANSITTVQPNFGDIPSQLFSGADVVKSPTASLLNSGITGTINLKTRKPFDLKDGVTGAIAVEGAYGDKSKEWEPQLNGLVGYRGQRWGGLLSASYADVTQANYYNGLTGNSGWTGFASESGDFGADVNGDGDTADRFISYEGHSAYNKFTQRKRYGVNGSLQFDLGGGLELNADIFYTNQTQWDRTLGFTAENKWQGWAWFTPAGTTDQSNGINSTTTYNLAARRLKSYTEVNRTDSDSTNVNVELTYDKGGAFTGSVRGLYAEANQARVNSYADIDMANGSQWGIDPSYYAGGFQRPNPNGYAGLPPVTVSYGAHQNWSSLPSFLSDVNTYGIGAMSSENNYDRTAKMGIVRADGQYEFDSGFKLLGGLRYSSREASNDAYDYLAPINGCLVKWKATDVVLNGGGIAGACTAGDAGGFYTALKPTPLSSFGKDAIFVTDFGSVGGLPGVWAIDPRAMDNPLAFQNAQFPGNVRVANPGGSYAVDVKQTSGYVQGSFTGNAGVPFSANAGVRVIQTKLDIQQNAVGAAQPYGAANADGGDVMTNRSFVDVLPAFNIAFDLRDDLKLRAAFAKNMTMLDLEQWGGALTPSYALNSSVTPARFEVIGANANGNPQLDPWRSTNYDLSLEWYLRPGSLINVGLFYVEVESFIERGVVNMPLPDQDGVVRRNVDVATNVQGDGGVLKGAEFGIKQAFDFLPGIWSNFGVDANYTYSPSDAGKNDLSGASVPFQDNSIHQTNLVFWYQGDRLQARIAHNFRSKRAVASDQVWSTPGLTLYQQSTQFVDASVSYDITPNVTAYVQGSNLTKEHEDYYFQWKDQYAYQNEYERRVVVGVRARF